MMQTIKKPPSHWPGGYEHTQSESARPFGWLLLLVAAVSHHEYTLSISVRRL
jgi:hypothetical protein